MGFGCTTACRKQTSAIHSPASMGALVIAVFAQANVDLRIGLVAALIVKRLRSYQRPTKAEARIVVA